MRWMVLTSLLLLSACGVADVASTSAVGAKLQAEQAKQAKQGKQSMDKMRADLDAAAKAGQERNAAAEEASK